MFEFVFLRYKRLFFNIGRNGFLFDALFMTLTVLVFRLGTSAGTPPRVDSSAVWEREYSSPRPPAPPS